MQLRVPAGNTGGGQWTSEGGGDASTTAGEVRADTHTADPHADDRQKPIQVADSGQIATDTGIQLAGNDDVIPGPETPMGQNPLDPAEIHKPLTPERKQAVADTIQKIMDGNVSDLSPHPYKNLPSFNTGARLPTSSTGYVTYYVPPDPSGSDMSRIVVEVGTGRMYYTGDHYDSFIPINIQRIH